MDSATYQVRLKELEARVEALKEQIGRKRTGPILAPDDAGAAPDEARVDDARSE